ncbi:hypothetical protein J7M28_09075, partial [bacterium]|nr:hypothetical protein [bacterium]
IMRKRQVELLASLSEKMIHHSPHSWNDEECWLPNAELEHESQPFHAILARENPNGHPYVIDDVFVGDGGHALWAVKTGCCPARKGEDMASAVAPLLRCSQDVILVDPHFRPWERRYQMSFEEIFLALMANRGSRLRPDVEVQLNTKLGYGHFCDGLQRHMPQRIPENLSVSFRRLKQKAGGDKVHNRYILTELGGIKIAPGLDEGDTGETCDFNLMDREQYEKRWAQYAGGAPAFDADRDPIEILGTRETRRRRSTR